MPLIIGNQTLWPVTRGRVLIFYTPPVHASLSARFWIAETITRHVTAFNSNLSTFMRLNARVMFFTSDRCSGKSDPSGFGTDQIGSGDRADFRSPRFAETKQKPVSRCRRGVISLSARRCCCCCCCYLSTPVIMIRRVGPLSSRP